MQVKIQSPAEMTDAKVLAHIPEGKLIKESALLAALARSKGGMPAGTPGSLERLVLSRQIAVIEIPGDILTLQPPRKFYSRSLRCYPLREQTGLDKKDRNINALLATEGHYISPSRLFAHSKMPAHWQQETVLVRSGQVLARGSFAAVAAEYAQNIKDGRGKMVIHRLGTKFEADPNRLLRDFRAALARKK